MHTGSTGIEPPISLTILCLVFTGIMIALTPALLPTAHAQTNGTPPAANAQADSPEDAGHPEMRAIDPDEVAQEGPAASANQDTSMYQDIMRPPETPLDRVKEQWVQRTMLILGIATIIGVYALVRFKSRS